MERTSPTRFGIEVPRLKCRQQSVRGEVHGEDYYCRSGFGKAGDGGACDRPGGTDGAAQGASSRAVAALDGDAAAVRGGDGSLRWGALLGAGIDATRSHGAHHRGRVRAGVSQEREERCQRCRSDLHGGATTEHAVRGDKVGGTASGAMRASTAPWFGRGAHYLDQSTAWTAHRVRCGGGVGNWRAARTRTTCDCRPRCASSSA